MECAGRNVVQCMVSVMFIFWQAKMRMWPGCSRWSGQTLILAVADSYYIMMFAHADASKDLLNPTSQYSIMTFRMHTLTSPKELLSTVGVIQSNFKQDLTCVRIGVLYYHTLHLETWIQNGYTMCIMLGKYKFGPFCWRMKSTKCCHTNSFIINFIHWMFCSSNAGLSRKTEIACILKLNTLIYSQRILGHVWMIQQHDYAKTECVS